MNNQDDTVDLIQQALTGEERACQSILNLYKGRIFSYVYRLVHNYHDAEDITFDTFIKCFRSLAMFDQSKPFTTWLFTIAHNLTVDYFRKHKTPPEYLVEMHPGGDDPVTEYERKRRAEIVDDALARLAPVDRELVILFHKEEHSYQEIAGIMNLPVTTIKTRLHRARKKLHDIVCRKRNKP
ncbi:RNA polymerase sigma factor [candidate division WOR-3 bacterium]|nr:RNA polymerase sigma factor [candidate division WOR-3 bacterium]